AADRPTAGTESQQRGAGGDLRIIQWQAPSHLSGPTATGDKDNLGASLVSESLLLRLPDGRLIPNLVKEVPTVENGLLAEDFTSVTYNLLEGVLWSDGQPFTANDVVFTWRWIMDDSNGAILQESNAQIANMEAVDDLTVRVTFNEPNPTWSDTQTGQGSSVVLPAHILEGGGKEANDAFRLNPIGTGPYKVESFAANDQVVYVVNENYREPTKPFFGRVTIKGGGDAASAARAVIQTGEYDYAWNLAIEPEIARSFESEDSPGVLLVSPGLGIERININFSDPRKEVTTEVPSATPEAAPTQVTQRSEKNTPHPIFSDIAVRQAMNLAIDRETIANSFFFGGEVEPAVVNILSGIPALESPNTAVVYDPEGAAALLDGAGWVLDGDVRTKDGLELSIDFMTTVSQLRQKIQAVVKRDLEEIGFRVELKSVDAAIFFDSAEGNEQNNTHFYNDLNMFTSGVGSPPPVSYMIRWYAGPDGRNIAQAQNAWTGRNFQRYQNPEYDALYEASRTESDPEAQAELFIQMNDILFNDAAVLPLVRTGDKIGYNRTLNVENIAPGPYEFDYWNIANWNRVS
ncbi:MAG TPA: peptide ABC transporter substrate-binding protein, partial [Thermomicrobiales bacterium]|nr:peptide ABC transporter substrate-binding protein [Thermomicrobiales bacterium]